MLVVLRLKHLVVPSVQQTYPTDPLEPSLKTLTDLHLAPTDLADQTLTDLIDRLALNLAAPIVLRTYRL